MLRLKLIIIAIGAVFFYEGFKEYQVGKNAGSEAVAVDLVAFEQSKKLPTNTYLSFKNVWGVTEFLTYSYELPKGADDEVKPEYEVKYAYIPLISSGHPYNVAWDKIYAEYSDFSDVPEEKFPEMESFQVLLKTKEYKTIAALPENWLSFDNIEGLVINKVDSLEDDEKRLIKESFPTINFDEILILEHNRKPLSVIVSYSMMGGSGLIALLGIVWLVKGRRKDKEAE